MLVQDVFYCISLPVNKSLFFLWIEDRIWPLLIAAGFRVQATSIPLPYHCSYLLTRLPDSALALFNTVSIQQLRVVFVFLFKAWHPLLSRFISYYSGHSTPVTLLSLQILVPGRHSPISGSHVCCFLYLECFSPDICMVCIFFQIFIQSSPQWILPWLFYCSCNHLLLSIFPLLACVTCIPYFFR